MRNPIKERRLRPQTSSYDYDSDGRAFTTSSTINLIYRVLQIVGACVDIGYYGYDLNQARKVHKYSDGKWVFAVVVASMAAVTALVLIVIGCMAHYRKVALLFPWEWVLVVLWAVVAGIFGGMYFGEDTHFQPEIKDMIIAAGFACANLILWAISAIVGTFVFFRSGRRSLFTGRARHGG